jgi:predicted KAP-like P-loop ATPase
MNNILKVDKPIKTKNEDFLDRKAFAEVVTNAIVDYHMDGDESLTIGLFGKWGTGKTSIINMILEDIEQEDDILIFNFEPWLYSDTEQLISQFFKDFAKVVNHKDYGRDAARIGEELEAYANFFDVISHIPEPTTFVLSKAASKVFKTVGHASSKWGKLKSKNLSQIKASIEQHLKKFDKKILIIIDDIDRLNNTEIKQIFQLIRSLGNFPNTIYLASMDRDVVIDALSEMQKGDGSEYLEKIVHVPLQVPSISQDKVYEFLFMKLDEIIGTLPDKKFDQNYWGNIYHSGFKYFFNNVRDVIRYMNILRFNFSAIGNEVNIIDLIAITGFQVFEPKIYEIIKNNPDMFTGQIRESISYSNSNDEEKHTVRKYIEKSYEQLEKLEQEAYLEFIQEIFVKVKEAFTNITYTEAWRECRKEAKLCSPEFFNIYFKASIDEDLISKTQMESYIKSTSREDEFHKVIEQLNSDGKIYVFLERLEDYIYDFDKDKSQVICNVLMDLGDSFPEKKGMFEFGKKIRVRRVISRLLNKIEDKNEWFEILKEAIQKANNSIDIPALEVSSIMQQHGEYDKEAKHEPQQLVTNEHLQELKKLLLSKIKEWTKKYNFKDDKISLSLLYIWKRLDVKAMKMYLNEHLKDKEELLYFLKIFNTVSFSQTSGDYTTREHKEFSYKNIEDFIDYDFVESRIREIDISKYSEDIQFAVEIFLDYFDGNINEDDD